MEYLKVLMRPGIRPDGISDQDITDFIDNLVNAAQAYDIYYLWRPWLKDEEDDMILELAVTSQASYVITFNAKDLPLQNLLRLYFYSHITKCRVSRQLIQNSFVGQIVDRYSGKPRSNI